MVQAEKLDAASLIAAMEAGKSYSSTWVSLEEVSFENNEFEIKVATAEGVNYKIEFIGVSMDENQSRVLKSIEGVEGSFEVTDEYLFVRAFITSSKLQENLFQDGNIERAWTQPVFLEVGRSNKQ